MQTVKLYLFKSGVSYMLISSVLMAPKMVYDRPVHWRGHSDKNETGLLRFVGLD